MLIRLVGLLLLASSDLPTGPAPEPVPLPHFPDRFHAFVWRNWQLVPAERMAKVVGAKKGDILRVGKAMGLNGPPPISEDQRRRSYISIIRRNWHLLPYDQLIELLGWTPERMDYTLREDDFLYIKLGRLKPKCEPLKFAEPDEKAKAREQEMARILKEEFGGFAQVLGHLQEPLFGFIPALSEKIPENFRASNESKSAASSLSPRFCYSYFALYGDPLMDQETDPFPDGYLQRLAQSGVDGVWLQGVLYKLAPFPWDAKLSEHYETRLKNLKSLVERAKKNGIGVYLYLNEPRAMPLRFFDSRPNLKGVTEGEDATLCTSAPEVQQYVADAVASICRAAPDLAGIFTITASENLTNCWSHGAGKNCPRCSKRSPAEVIAEVNSLIEKGIQQAGAKTQLIAWDWGWNDDWADSAIRFLPKESALMSVSEWSIPIQRGGIKSAIGEYSISEIGPGPRAKRHWRIARERGLKTIAKIQANNTWELAAVPHIPAVANVAQHAANLRAEKVDGLMLGWTLGGCPSPNLEVVAEIGNGNATPDEAMMKVAERRFGPTVAPLMVQVWKDFSAAFAEFPYDGAVLYNGPQQYGPANLLWEKPTGYKSTMTGFPYDDLDGWRGVYPSEILVAQFEKVAAGFEKTLRTFNARLQSSGVSLEPRYMDNLAQELTFASALTLHYRSSAWQGRFILARRSLASAQNGDQAKSAIENLETALRNEIIQAAGLRKLQSSDSRLGFEATNHYFYVPNDLAEKVLNCRDLLDRWIPEQKRKFGIKE